MNKKSMPYSTFDSIRIYYEIHGPSTAYPVVLIHPIDRNIMIWEHLFMQQLWEI